jgi:hypothetical protein
LTIHCTPESGAAKSVLISSSATFTTVRSSTTIATDRQATIVVASQPWRPGAVASEATRNIPSFGRAAFCACKLRTVIVLVKS